MAKCDGWRFTVAAIVLAAGLSTHAGADVAPGERITADTVEKVKDLISPGLEWCIKRGFPMTITETRRVEWPQAYKDATEKYSAQVKLRPDGLQLLNRRNSTVFQTRQQRVPTRQCGRALA